jgi:hypothetical protein
MRNLMILLVVTILSVSCTSKSGERAKNLAKQPTEIVELGPDMNVRIVQKRKTPFGELGVFEVMGCEYIILKSNSSSILQMIHHEGCSGLSHKHN